MTMFFAKRSSHPLLLLCTAGFLGLSSLWPAAPSHAQTWGRPAYAPPPVPYPAAPYRGGRPQGGYGGYGQPWGVQGPGSQTVYDNDPASWNLSEAQMAQRCNIGRLMGGLLGGGVGYATSRQDGRSWAVPLGALLGSQIGCNVGTGRGPVPW